jgi:hypothetical protein
LSKAAAMTIPEEFRFMCIHFYQGVTDDFSSKQEMISFAISDLNSDQRKVVRAHLDELMSGIYSEEEIEKIWRQAGADVRISRGVKGDATKFLAEIRKALDN